jgi:hypothetical protein
MVVTTGDNYVGTAEPELREKISSLYGVTASYAGKPSQAQLANLRELQTQLATVASDMQAVIADTEKAIQMHAGKAAQALRIQYRSKETFLNADN